MLSGGEYVYGGRDWNTGEYWSVSLSESIWYDDGIVLVQLGDKERKEKFGHFPPDLNCPDIKISDIKK